MFRCKLHKNWDFFLIYKAAWPCLLPNLFKLYPVRDYMDWEREQAWASGNPGSQWQTSRPSKGLLCSGRFCVSYLHTSCGLLLPINCTELSVTPKRIWHDKLMWRCKWHNGRNIPPSRHSLNPEEWLSTGCRVWDGDLSTQGNSLKITPNMWFGEIKLALFIRMFLLRVTSKCRTEGTSIMIECFFLDYLLGNWITKELTLGSEQPEFYSWLQHIPAMWPSVSSETQFPICKMGL